MIAINRQQQLEELYTDWNELEAYRDLNGQPFDFDTGLITWDAPGSEEVYWKMEQWSIDNWINILEDDYYCKNKSSKTYKKRLNKYNRKQIDKIKLQQLSKISWWPVYYSERKGRYIRSYLSGRKGYAKWCSKKAVRNTNDFCLRGNGYRKVYDYWWVVF